MKLFSKIKLNQIILLWIVLWCINLFNLRLHIWLLGGGIAFIVVRNIHFLNRSIFLQSFNIVIFSALYALATFGKKGAGFLILYMVVPISAFLIGYYYVLKEKFFKKAVLLLFDTACASMILYASLNMMYLFVHGWSYNLRGTYDFWTGAHINATNQGGYLVFTATYLPLLFFCRREIGRRKVFLYSAEIGLSVIYTLLLGNRTYFVLALLVTFLSYFFYLHKKRKKGSHIFKSIMALVAVLIVLTVLYSINFAGIKTFWQSTTFYTRMQYMGTKYDVTLRENDRFPTWIKTIMTIPNHIFGGMPDGVTISYAHNMWLDIQWVGGIFPLFIMIVITLYFIVTAKKAYEHSKNNVVIRMFLAGYTLTILLECAVEPIIEGYFQVFVMFFMMYGALNALSFRMKQEQLLFIEKGLTDD